MKCHPSTENTTCVTLTQPLQNERPTPRRNSDSTCTRVCKESFRYSRNLESWDSFLFSVYQECRRKHGMVPTRDSRGPGTLPRYSRRPTSESGEVVETRGVSSSTWVTVQEWRWKTSTRLEYRDTVSEPIGSTRYKWQNNYVLIVTIHPLLDRETLLIKGYVYQTDV